MNSFSFPKFSRSLVIETPQSVLTNQDLPHCGWRGCQVSPKAKDHAIPGSSWREKKEGIIIG
jgi:hypothetical protein